ncbi:unnamed protein product, partial [Protopolystoma xenopodis]
FDRLHDLLNSSSIARQHARFSAIFLPSVTFHRHSSFARLSPRELSMAELQSRRRVRLERVQQLGLLAGLVMQNSTATTEKCREEGCYRRNHYDQGNSPSPSSARMCSSCLSQFHLSPDDGSNSRMRGVHYAMPVSHSVTNAYFCCQHHNFTSESGSSLWYQCRDLGRWNDNSSFLEASAGLLCRQSNKIHARLSQFKMKRVLQSLMSQY